MKNMNLTMKVLMSLLTSIYNNTHKMKNILCHPPILWYLQLNTNELYMPFISPYNPTKLNKSVMHVPYNIPIKLTKQLSDSLMFHTHNRTDSLNTIINSCNVLTTSKIFPINRHG